MIQANILHVGVTSTKYVDQASSSGYGGAISGMIVGAATGKLLHDSGKSTLLGGLIGGVAGMTLDSMVKDVVYSMVTDLQISERVPAGVISNQSTQSQLQQGSSSTVNVTSNQSSNWNKYQTRIVSSANKVNLKFEEAVPELVDGLSRSISELL